jgi:hypothetical protein
MDASIKAACNKFQKDNLKKVPLIQEKEKEIREEKAKIKNKISFVLPRPE